MKKLRTLIVLVAVVMFASCASTNVEDGLLSVGNISNTECQRATRADSYPEDPILRLTMQGNNINGEFINCPVGCDHGDLGVSCKLVGSDFKIKVTDSIEGKENDGIMENCSCTVNIYFTVYDVEGDYFHITLSSYDIDIPDVSFKESSIVEINLRTKEQKIK